MPSGCGVNTLAIVRHNYLTLGSLVTIWLWCDHGLDPNHKHPSHTRRVAGEVLGGFVRLVFVNQLRYLLTA